MLKAKLSFARNKVGELRRVHPDDRRAEIQHMVMCWIFPYGGRDLVFGPYKVRLLSIGTSSGVERRARVGQFARWDFELRLWRAG